MATFTVSSRCVRCDMEWEEEHETPTNENVFKIEARQTEACPSCNSSALVVGIRQIGHTSTGLNPEGDKH